MRQGNLVLRLSILAHGKVIIEYMVVSSLYLHVAPSELELCDMIELAVSVSHEHHEHQQSPAFKFRLVFFSFKSCVGHPFSRPPVDRFGKKNLVDLI